MCGLPWISFSVWLDRDRELPDPEDPEVQIAGSEPDRHPRQTIFYLFYLWT